MEEIWKDVPGYDGLYQVSNLGRVKSMKKTYLICNKVAYTKQESILKQSLTKGYYKVELNSRGKSKNFLVHRLVAMAFIPNPNNLPQINHKDENPQNNCVDNLEWCTLDYNLSYGTRQKRMSQNRKRKVLQYSKTGQFIEEFDGAIDAEINTGVFRQNINKVILGKRHTAGGFIWKKGGKNERKNY